MCIKSPLDTSMICILFRKRHLPTQPAIDLNRSDIFNWESTTQQRFDDRKTAEKLADGKIRQRVESAFCLKFKATCSLHA